MEALIASDGDGVSGSRVSPGRDTDESASLKRYVAMWIAPAEFPKRKMLEVSICDAMGQLEE